MSPDAYDDLLEQPIRKRSTKACDNCRHMKSKCERESIDQSCRRCDQEGLECTSDAPVRRRGPPKGYLQLVETRLHELEAVMGVLISNPNPAIRNLFTDLSQDPFARSVMEHVAGSAFGPRALARYATQHDSGALPPSTSRQHQALPNNDWQLQAVRTMISRSQAREREREEERVMEHQVSQMSGPSTSYAGHTYPGGLEPAATPMSSEDPITPSLEELLRLWEYETFFQPDNHPN